MNMDERIEKLEVQVKELEKALEKMQICATVMKDVVQESTGKNIDEMLEKEMKNG